jgi:hypothetical protein
MGTEAAGVPGLNSRPSDDEILGLTTHVPRKHGRTQPDGAARDSALGTDGESDRTGCRRIYAKCLRPTRSCARLGKTHASIAKHSRPLKKARAATALLGDLNRMDALFYSKRREDHELARAVAQLDPAAFASLAREMANLAPGAPQRSGQEVRQTGRVAQRQEVRRFVHIITRRGQAAQLVWRRVYGPGQKALKGQRRTSPRKKAIQTRERLLVELRPSLPLAYELAQ